VAGPTLRIQGQGGGGCRCHVGDRTQDPERPVSIPAMRLHSRHVASCGWCSPQGRRDTVMPQSVRACVASVRHILSLRSARCVALSSGIAVGRRGRLRGLMGSALTITVISSSLTRSPYFRYSRRIDLIRSCRRATRRTSVDEPRNAAPSGRLVSRLAEMLGQIPMVLLVPSLVGPLLDPAC
jgi:hypothetical protein